MSTLTWIALAIGVLAVLGLGVGLSDAWFCGLLALSALLGGADAAYRNVQPWPVILLLTGTMLAGASVHAAVRDRRRP